MCGIAGFTGQGDLRSLERMINAIRYRGPDAQICHCDNEVALSHARLSILDLRPEGNCPMFTADNQIVITFNGEIYNYLALRKDLESRYTFQTTTDTEVLLYLYKEYGVDMLKQINGMFAFAIYDYQKKELFLARDRMGKKPLYYSETSKGFVFASELKALLEHPTIEKKLNLDAVNQYLTFDYVPTPNTIIKDIYKLEAAHYIVVKNNKIVTKSAYWEHRFITNNQIRFQDAVIQLDQLLDNATRIRLMGDVPSGVFLSGGLDSSTIAYYAQKNSSRPIKTFSIGFQDSSYDETNYAKQVADHLGTDHHTRVLTSQHTLALIDKIYSLVDEPFADASLIPTFFLSQYTREHVTFALGGDGSDELQAGYPTFISNKFKYLFSKLPLPVIRALTGTMNKTLPSSDKNISFDFKVKQFLRGFISKKEHIHQLWLGSFLPHEKQQLFTSDAYSLLKDRLGLSHIDEVYSRLPNEWSDLNKVIYYYYQTYLQDDILVKVDRASMYNSLEVRAPFLDRSVVEFYNTLPDNFRQKGFQGKYILKKLMQDKLPKEIVFRNKKGFGIPLSDWIRNDLKSEIETILLLPDSYFNPGYIKNLLQEHLSKKSNHRKLIWNLYILKRYLKQNDLLGS